MTRHRAVGIGTHRWRAGRREGPLRLTGDTRHDPGNAAVQVQRMLGAHAASERTGASIHTCRSSWMETLPEIHHSITEPWAVDLRSRGVDILVQG